MLAKAMSFVVSAAQHLAAGSPETAPEEFARRITLCQACPFYSEKATCQLCGCGELKVWWDDQHCVIGKW